MSSKNHESWTEGTMADGRPQGMPSRQIDPGFYHVNSRIGDEEVEAGALFVEGDKASGVLIEHWVLSDKHASPRGLQSMQVTENATESFGGLSQFLDTMRERSRSWGSVTYIKATCEYFDGIPES